MKIRHMFGSEMLFGLGAQGVEHYAATAPQLDLRTYFSGQLTASGVFFGLSGRVLRHFTMRMDGRWSGNEGAVEEKFHYDNGELGERRWQFAFSDAHADVQRFSVTAPDVKGVGEGAQRGNAAVMRYRLIVPRAKGEIVVGMEDWFYLTADGALVNRGRMTKFGLKVGEVFATFSKPAAGKAGTQ